MSLNLIFHSDIKALADEYSAFLAASGGVENSRFKTPLILIPNIYMKKWLQRHVAEKNGIDMGCHYNFLDKGCWQILSACDPENPKKGNFKVWKGMPGYLTREWMLWFIFAVLKGRVLDPEILEPFYNYVGDHEDIDWHDSMVIRKSWQYASSMARLFRDYEYLIPGWVDCDHEINKKFIRDKSAVMQREIYIAIFKKGGIRDIACDGKRLLLSQPQYFWRLRVDGTVDFSYLKEHGISGISLFGFENITPWHADFIKDLSNKVEVTVFHHKLVGFNSCDEIVADDVVLGNIVKQWAGVEQDSRKLWLSVADNVHELEEKVYEPTSCLLQVQEKLKTGFASHESIQCDETLDIIKAPGIRREVEYVRDSIIRRYAGKEDIKYNLEDIGILVTDMAQYKPVVESVFDEPWLNLRINIIDAELQKESFYADAIDRIMKLKGGRWTANEIFELAENPCFKAGCGITDEDLNVWRDRAATLGIRYGFDAADKRLSLCADSLEKQDYANKSERFTWGQGIRRLRMGKILSVNNNDDSGFWNGECPFSDINSSASASVDEFAVKIEVLHKVIKKLPESDTISNWGRGLKNIFDMFLGISSEISGEKSIREIINEQLADENLELIDSIFTAADPVEEGLSFIVFSLFLQQALAGLSSSRGNYLSGGPSFAKIQHGRPVPFKEIFVLGLGQDNFPGSNVVSPLDIMADQTIPGRHKPVELNQGGFLQAVMAAGHRLTLSWVGRDLQKDKDIFPCSLLASMIDILGKYSNVGEHVIKTIPLHNEDACCNDECFELFSPYEKALLFSNFCHGFTPDANGRETALNSIRSFINGKLSGSTPGKISDGKNNDIIVPGKIHLKRLAGYLENSMVAVLKERYGIYEDEELVDLPDEEPLETVFPYDGFVRNESVKSAIGLIRTNDEYDAGTAARNSVENVYNILECRSKAPEGGFAFRDKSRFVEDVEGIVAKTVKKFEEHVDSDIYDVVSFGSETSEDKNKLILPELILNVGGNNIRLYGEIGFVCHNRNSSELEIITYAEWSPSVKIRHFLRPLVGCAMLCNFEKFKEIESFKITVVKKDGASSTKIIPRKFNNDIFEGFFGRNNSAAFPASLDEWLDILISDFIIDNGRSLVPGSIACDFIEKMVVRLMEGKDVSDMLNSNKYFLRMVKDSSASSFSELQIPAYLELIDWSYPDDIGLQIIKRYAPFIHDIQQRISKKKKGAAK